MNKATAHGDIIWELALRQYLLADIPEFVG